MALRVVGGAEARPRGHPRAEAHPPVWRGMGPPAGLNSSAGCRPVGGDVEGDGARLQSERAFQGFQRLREASMGVPRRETSVIMGFVKFQHRAARVHQGLYIRRARPVDISQHDATSTTGSDRRHTAKCGVQPRDHRGVSGRQVSPWFSPARRIRRVCFPRAYRDRSGRRQRSCRDDVRTVPR